MTVQECVVRSHSQWHINLPTIISLCHSIKSTGYNLWTKLPTGCYLLNASLKFKCVPGLPLFNEKWSVNERYSDVIVVTHCIQQ